MADEKPKEAKPEPIEWGPETGHLFPGAEIPAMYSNIFQVLVGGEGLRLAFGETLWGEPPKMRLAVRMSMANARELVKILADLISTQEQSAVEATSEKHGNNPN